MDMECEHVCLRHYLEVCSCRAKWSRVEGRFGECECECDIPAVLCPPFSLSAGRQSTSRFRIERRKLDGKS